MFVKTFSQALPTRLSPSFPRQLQGPSTTFSQMPSLYSHIPPETPIRTFMSSSIVRSGDGDDIESIDAIRRRFTSNKKAKELATKLRSPDNIISRAYSEFHEENKGILLKKQSEGTLQGHEKQILDMMSNIQYKPKKKIITAEQQRIMTMKRKAAKKNSK
eukprot:TRINITY_DN26373_c0_g1_i1.p1 TRINITY_DN26373_c0_g1~~TRINITY_DN26373_c0_g1_i1.p1  ORF type:complete len:174 (-),score=46.38 TRINITY_DN26373_c0_g1_i1:17-496(-)